MDLADGSYQAMDRKELLNEHGKPLVADARAAIAENPSVRLAGLITTPDAAEAAAIRQWITKLSGSPPPVGLMVGIVPRQFVEPLLTQHVSAQLWLEQGCQRQRVLPVVVSTRDGHRFGLFHLTETPGRASEM